MPAPAARPLRVTVLGQVTACAQSGDPLLPVSGRGADLVAALVLASGSPASAERLIDEVWPDGPPASGRAALQTLVSRLRAGHGADLVRSTAAGYALGVPAAEVDLLRAEAAATDARAALDAGDPRSATDLTAAALAELGAPDSGVPEPELRAAVTTRAERARTDLLRSRVAALLAGAAPAAALPAAEELAALAPLDDAAQLALMRALHAAGRSSEALVSFAAYRERLADQLGTDPTAQVTDFHLQLLTAQAPATRPRVLGVRAVPGDLLGRDQDLDAVQRALTGAAVVTVLGTGGLGKTRLVQEVARRAADRGEAVAVVELASVRSPEDLLPALADALRVPDPVRTPGAPADPRGIQDRVADRLADHPTLLVLDNCEQVLGAVAGVVTELCATVPGLRVLTTSRAPLGVPGEQVHPLLPLPATAPDGGPGPAVALFTARATAVRPGVVLPPEVLDRLCRKLDGLPLAIELAAARTRSMTVEEIDRRLSDRFGLLTGGGAGLPERHRTLHAVIAWSWDLLTASQRVLARRVAALPDGFPAEAAVALAGPGADEVAVLDDLDALVAQSLLRAEEHRPTRSMRYRMLELVREFGEREARAAGDEELIRHAIGDWARDLAADRIGPDGPDRVQLDPVIEREQDNLVAVLRGELARGVDARLDVAVALFGVAAMRWLLQGAHDELVQVQRRLLGLARDWTPPPELADAAVLGFGVAALTEVMWGDLRHGALARRLVARARTAGPVSPVHELLAGLVREVADPVELDRLLADARVSGDPATRRFSLLGSWSIAENDGRIDDAIGHAEKAYHLGRQQDDPWTLALAAVQLACAHTQSGRPAEAVPWIDEAERAMDRLHELEAGPAIMAIEEGLWQIRGLTLLALGEFEAAAHLFGRMAVESQDQREAATLTKLGAAETAFGRGELTTALAHYRELLAATDGDEWRQNPWRLIATGVCLAAHALAGETGHPAVVAAAGSVRSIPIRAGSRAVPYADRPVLGVLLLGTAAWRMAVGEAEHTVLPLMALAERMRSRQDYRPLHRHLHWELATARYGEQAVAGARAAELAAGRAGELDRAIALLAG